MSLFLLGLMTLSTSVFAAGGSDYTSVDQKDCQTIESSSEPIDSYEGVCKGVGDYNVIISGGDIRYSLSLLYQGYRIDGLSNVTAFHDMGSTKIEWRYKSENGIKNYKALIYRLSIADENGNSRDSLYVVKLDGKNSCTVAVLTGQDNMNAMAREIADNVDIYPCKQENQDGLILF